MSILDIFSFKKQLSTVFTKENFKEVLNHAKETIIEQAKEKIAGSEKKAIVDIKVIYFIREKTVKLGISNKLVLWVVEKIVEAIPSITQAIYDFLKAQVENL